MTRNEAIVELNGVGKTYALGSTEVTALAEISISIAAGDFVSIAGPSGSGKTTILNLIGCIDVPSSGSVRVAGRTTSGLSDDDITALRRECLGFIFQSFNLIPVLTVRENIEFPLLLGQRAPGHEDREWVDHLIEEAGLIERRGHRPYELSGGQRQRVAIARALATRPKIVLADEPTANLDSRTGDAIIRLMHRINGESGTTFVFSTHDPTIVEAADHVIRLHDGRVVENRLVANSVGGTSPGPEHE